MRVLLITDDKNFRRTIINKFSKSNFSFIEYNGGIINSEMMEFIFLTSPQALLLDDDSLKPLSKITVEYLKAAFPNIKIIFITSDSSIECGKEIASLGVYYYGIKPISDDELQSIFQSIDSNKNNMIIQFKEDV